MQFNSCQFRVNFIIANIKGWQTYYMVSNHQTVIPYFIKFMALGKWHPTKLFASWTVKVYMGAQDSVPT